MVLFKYIDTLGCSHSIMCKDVDSAMRMFKRKFAEGQLLTGYITDDTQGVKLGESLLEQIEMIDCVEIY